MRNTSAKTLATTALLIAMEILLTRFFSIQTPVVRLGFGFLPIAMIGALYGPVYGGVAAAAADFIGVMLFPTAAFFPGFTLTAFLTGACYGLFLHKQPGTLIRIAAAVLVVALVFDLGLNTLWLQMITGKGYLAMLPTRVMKTLVIIPVQIVLIRLVVQERILRRVR